MRVGFDVSDLYPERAGVYTYSSQLLRHLRAVADPPELLLLQGDGRARRPLRALLARTPQSFCRPLTSGRGRCPRSALSLAPGAGATAAAC